MNFKQDLLTTGAAIIIALLLTACMPSQKEHLAYVSIFLFFYGILDPTITYVVRKIVQ